MNAPSQPPRGSLLYVSLLASVAALGGLLFGYDTAVISGALGYIETFFDLGSLTLDQMPGGLVWLCRTVFQLDPENLQGFWKGWAAGSALLGCALGAGLAGLLSDRLGRKKVLLLSALAFLASAVGTAFPWSFNGFVLFRMIGGLGIGAASITSPMYIAEISPAAVRGRLVSVNQLAIVTGMVLVYFVNYFIAWHGERTDRAAGIESHLQVAAAAEQREVHDLAESADSQIAVAAKLNPDSWNVQRGWRWMFGSGAVPSLLLLGLLLVVPESPRWLTKQDRRGEALAVLTRVGGPQRAAVELAEIEDAVAHESGSLRQLLLPGMRVVLAIGVTLAVLQQVTGINVFLYYAADIFKKMGSNVDASLLQQVVVGAVNMLFTIVAIRTVDRLGRKPLMLLGFTGMGLSLLALGAAAYLQRTELWVLVFILSYIACFALSVGPVTWVILSEIFPTRIRGRAMAIATVCLWIANFAVTQTFTIMDENVRMVERYHHALPYWIYAALAGVSVVFVWLCVPETKGKTLEEIERGWGIGRGGRPGAAD